MGKGATVLVEELYQEGKIDGILSLGGSGGTSLATPAMRALPVGVPKLMVLLWLLVIPGLTWTLRMSP